ncbi:TetR/AcrR family transcriptional regulator [Jatrophihabitans fulvus]
MARREDLLERVTEDLLAHGLADFSLRRVAQAAGTTHKVLLYHFGSAEHLLAAAVSRVRARRIDSGLAAALAVDGSLAERVLALWPALIGAEADVLDQAMGLAMYHPERYGALAHDALVEYLPPLRRLCPADWDAGRTEEIAGLVLATLRGLILTRRTSPDDFDAGFALAALARALEREEALDQK